jgi:uncharacterized protein YdeI (YjbR/CyaY-like superfamily)
MITNIEDYFTSGCGRCDRFNTPDCSTRRWQAGLAELRRICRSAGLAETVKWGHPCYTHAGRNVAIIGAFREDFRLTFFHAALLRDPAGLLERQGPNTRHADALRFTVNSHVAEREPAIRAFLEEAKAHAEAGRKPPPDHFEPDLPAELAEALAADPELAAAFQSLTRSRRKSYVINLNSARTSKTRIDRIARFREKILAGKGALER